MDFSKSVYIKGIGNLDGRAVIIFDCNHFRLTKENFSPMIAHIIKTFSTSLALSKVKCGIEEFCVMVNLRNIKKCHLTVKFLVCMTKILKSTFPDMLYKCFLKNPSIIFRSLYLVVRRLIDKKTRNKIVLVRNGTTVPYEESIIADSYD